MKLDVFCVGRRSDDFLTYWMCSLLDLGGSVFTRDSIPYLIGDEWPGPSCAVSIALMAKGGVGINGSCCSAYVQSISHCSIPATLLCLNTEPCWLLQPALAQVPRYGIFCSPLLGYEPFSRILCECKHAPGSVQTESIWLLNYVGGVEIARLNQGLC